MLVDCYRHLHDWQAIIELVGVLRKQRVLDDAALLELQLEAWRGRRTSGRESPDALWREVPKELRREPILVAPFATAMADAGEGAQAEAVVRAAITHAWNPDLVRLYGTLITADPAPQLVVAENWLKERPNDPDLLLTLGRVSLMNRQWAKAREYLEASLRLRRTAEAQGELGRLCAALGEVERGGELLSQALDGLPALPLPERTSSTGTHR
jgi:HemY protein